MDINDESVSLSSMPVPLTGEKTLVSDFPKSCITYDYRPTPAINPELLSNARVIHGIMSVPNRINLKRNQIFNEAYQNQLNEYVKNSKETSMSLEEMIEPTPPAPPVVESENVQNPEASNQDETDQTSDKPPVAAADEKDVVEKAQDGDKPSE